MEPLLPIFLISGLVSFQVCSHPIPDACSPPSFPEKRDVSEMDLLSSNGTLLTCFQCTDCAHLAKFDSCELTCPNKDFICYKDVFYNENNETVTNRGCTLPKDCASCEQNKVCTRYCCNADECNGGVFLRTSAGGLTLIAMTILLGGSL